MRALAIFLFLLPLSVFADRIVLKDGKEYRGTFVDGDGREVRFRINRRLVRTFRAADIAQLEIGDKRAADIARKTPLPVQEAERTMRPRLPVAAAQPDVTQTPPSTDQAPPPFVTPPQTGTSAANPIDGAAAIGSEYTRMGADTGVLGAPRAPHQVTADGRASVRFYAAGAIYWTPGAGAHGVGGPVFQAWLAQGGERSRLGFPTGDEQVSEGGFSRQQTFEGGRISWTQRDGASVVYSAR